MIDFLVRFKGDENNIKSYQDLREALMKYPVLKARNEIIFDFRQYKELDNPIQKVKINIRSVVSGTTSSAINEAIKRAQAGEITLSDRVKISA
nr:hypothetical protein [uncultured Campylobacter sp.]